jgi:adenylate cyclase
VHIDLSDQSKKNFGKLYIGRELFARLTDNLAIMGAQATVFDYIFADRIEPESDQQFVHASKRAGNVYVGSAVSLPSDSAKHRPINLPVTTRGLGQNVWQIHVDGDINALPVRQPLLSTFDDLLNAARGTGFLNMPSDADYVYRRTPLLVRLENGFLPSVALRVACDVLGVTPDNIVLTPGKSLTLKQAIPPGSSLPRDVIIPIDSNGNMLVNFLGPWDAMDHYDFYDVVHASDDREELELWKEELAGKVAVISDIWTGAGDVGTVPTDGNYPLSGVHANIIHSILTQNFLRQFSKAEMLPIELLLTLIMAFLALRLGTVKFAIAAVVTMTLYTASVTGAFSYANTILSLGRPIIISVFIIIAIAIYRFIMEERAKFESLRQRDFVRTTFGRYLSNEVVDELLDSPDGLTMNGETREVTFLVSDLRGFTAISSRFPPNEVINIVNFYFENMLEIILRHGGTVNEFMGDGMLVFFGAPMASGDEPERAMACAIAMQLQMPEVNAQLRAQGRPELAMGIGVHTGEVVVGNVGSEQRSSYTAVGNTINTAFRIESYTTGGQILISDTTYRRIRDLVTIRDTLEKKFKGVSETVVLYDVGSIQGHYNLALPEPEALEFRELPAPMPIQCFTLDGKTVSDVANPGQIMAIANNAARIQSALKLAVHDNLKIALSAADNPASAEIYAKVTEVEPARGGEAARAPVQVIFTWVSEQAKSLLATD